MPWLQTVPMEERLRFVHDAFSDRVTMSELCARFVTFVENLRASGWYTGPLLLIDVSEIGFTSNEGHLIAV